MAKQGSAGRQNMDTIKEMLDVERARLRRRLETMAEEDEEPGGSGRATGRLYRIVRACTDE